MPSLVLSSQYTSDSQVLREAARDLGWETLRLGGQRLPDWFDPPDQEIAMFFTAPCAFDVASQLGRSLTGCPPEWTIALPENFLSREIRQTTLSDALAITKPQFVKHSVSKAFPAAVYTSQSLAEATERIQLTSVVHVGEPVSFEVEYRCFVYDRSIATICPYLRYGNAIEDHVDTLGATAHELDAAKAFAQSVLDCDAVNCPPAFVLDVGLISGRGWAVIEFNECWASGIYSCDPERVLETLVRACVPSTSVEPEWDFQQHYFNACS
ncbi:MAG: ATP-grasp domain-containing protein [Planctomycetota bacterium]